jgi:hypothetical protein
MLGLNAMIRALCRGSLLTLQVSSQTFRFHKSFVPVPRALDIEYELSVCDLYRDRRSPFDFYAELGFKGQQPINPRFRRGRVRRIHSILRC